MVDIYKKRFGELEEQMEALLESKVSNYNSFLEKSEIEIDENRLLEWKVKTRSLLSKACGADSEHYQAFSDNEDTGMYGTYLATLERLRAVFFAGSCSQPDNSSSHPSFGRSPTERSTQWLY